LCIRSPKEYLHTNKKIIFSLLIGLTLLIAVLLFRTFSVSSGGTATTDYEKIKLDGKKISQHLSAAIAFKTIFEQDPDDIHYAEFTSFINWLADTYPKVHAQLTLIRINEFTLLY
jgi:carboxypeptidase PM20D1